MNDHIKEFCRDFLRTNLKKCTDAEQLLFIKMYSSNNLDVDINTAVNRMHSDKYDHAMMQVQRTLDKRKEMIEISTYSIDLEIGICYQCFLYGSTHEGGICNHPRWIGCKSDPVTGYYENAISAGRGNIPKKCPLRKEKSNITYNIQLRGEHVGS